MTDEFKKALNVAAALNMQLAPGFIRSGFRTVGKRVPVIEYDCENCGKTMHALVTPAVMAQDKFDLPVPCCSEDCKTKFEENK